jgi:hypothetical protein
VPANVAALLLRAVPGAELSCRAHEMPVAEQGQVIRRGCLSYYATATLASAATLQAWMDQITAWSQADLAQGRITAWYQPQLQLWGDPHRRLPGDVAPADRPERS